MKTLYEKIKLARENLHLSPEYVGKFLGKNGTFVRDLEEGKEIIDTNILNKLSQIYRIPALDFLRGDPYLGQDFNEEFVNNCSKEDIDELLRMIAMKKQLKNKKKEAEKEMAQKKAEIEANPRSLFRKFRA